MAIKPNKALTVSAKLTFFLVTISQIFNGVKVSTNVDKLLDRYPIGI